MYWQLSQMHYALLGEIAEIQTERAKLVLLTKLKTEGVNTTMFQSFLQYVGIGTIAGVSGLGLGIAAAVSPIALPLIIGLGMFTTGAVMEASRDKVPQ